MKTHNAFRRGFTLIELMIVIVILGILMGTILPRLTGAQGRARDTARISDLNNISQALEVYYNDKGSYPAAPAGECLSEGGTGSADAKALGVYMKGGKVPVPSNVSLKSVNCQGAYYYKSLTKNGVSNAAYVLVADLETYQMANYHLGGTTPSTPNNLGSYDEITQKIKSAVTSTADKTNSLSTVYVVVP